MAETERNGQEIIRRRLCSGHCRDDHREKPGEPGRLGTLDMLRLCCCCISATVRAHIPRERVWLGWASGRLGDATR